MKKSPIACLLLTVLFASGCASVRVRTDNVSASRLERAVLKEFSADPSPAARALAEAGTKGLSEAERTAHLVRAARLAFPSGSETTSSPIYNAAVTGLVEIFADNDFRAITLPDGSTITTAERGMPDPLVADELIPASAITTRGLREDARLDGLGVPYVAVFKKGNPSLNGQPGVPSSGLVSAVTAVASPDGANMVIEFFPSWKKGTARIAGRTYTLAADFSAALAIQIARGRNRSLDLYGMLFTDRRIGDMGLYQFQPFDPDKKVVIFVHGLMSRPETWTHAMNAMLADPEIRNHYQFWYFLYPTGLPIWGSAAELREEINRFHEVLGKRGEGAARNDKIIVGHSMGGIVSNLQVRDGGAALWSQFSDASPEALPVSGEMKDMIRRVVFFRAHSDISRVVFMATPHRGSPFSMRPISSIGAGLIRLPFEAFMVERRNVLLLLREETRPLFTAPANSIRFLRPNSLLLTSILNLPVPHKVTFHSIVGDRGRADSPDSSDGIVPYWSSLFPGAFSEKIVPSAHGVNSHPEGIAELIRILHEAKEPS
jgi:pimeloyl-ACP methyl ester carboxylesterase